NLYQFDPRLVPTGSAYRRGQTIANNTLESFMNEEGNYPKSTAVILWGIETSRTQGETFSQILSYLGIGVKSTGANWAPRYEIIPIKELGRPRIDVTINICGFVRDMFPNLIENLSDVLMEIYDLDESDEENYFKANSKKLYKYLLEEGYSQEEAKELSVSRIFGPEAGNYGTGLTDIIESKNWEEEEELGTVFLENLKYVYNRKSHGEDVKELYEKNLKEVEIVSQIRSSNEYEITDLDHYYEFFGGLSKSVEILR
ncbi:MAG: cobaltochelatase subunit CobN, partial [Senegalia sp. (in: firmicutes)]